MFGEKILTTVRSVKDVIVVLSRGCLERCKDPEDWMYREIDEAIRCGKNVIPVFAEDFVQPAAAELATYPQKIQDLLQYQGYTLRIEHYDNVLGRIVAGLRAVPRDADDGDVHSAIAFLLEHGAGHLSDADKDGLIGTILSSRSGTKMAEVMSSFLRTNTRYYLNIRTRFNYDLAFDSEFRFGGVDIDSERYFKLSESLSYQKHVLDGEIGTQLWISFVTDLDRLDGSLRDETFIFSENLPMDKEDLARLIALTPEERLAFFTKCMRVRFNLNGTVLTPSEVLFNEAGIFAKYDLDEDPAVGGLLDVKLAFSMPHRKVAGYFFASISDPTYSPHISFSYPEDEMDVEMISFMNRNITTAEAKVFDGLREVTFEDEWVLPMSGALFLITPHFC